MRLLGGHAEGGRALLTLKLSRQQDLSVLDKEQCAPAGCSLDTEG